MKFAQFQPGMVFEQGPRHLTEEEIISFAKAYDPQWFHVDPVRAKAGPWKGLIASGWHTCGIAMKMAVEAALEGSESFASPGLDSVKWLKPVRPGDDLFWKGVVKAKRISNTREGLGILLWSWEVTNQKDETVLELDATSLFDISDSIEKDDE